MMLDGGRRIEAIVGDLDGRLLLREHAEGETARGDDLAEAMAGRALLTVATFSNWISSNPLLAAASATSTTARPSEPARSAGSAAATEAASRWVGLLQRGRISIYLLYSFLTLAATLLVVAQ